MTLRGFSIGLVAAVSISVPSAWAQERGRPADSQTTGSAVPRGSDSGSSSSSSSSGSNSGSASSAPSSSGSWMDNSSQRSEVQRAPVRPERYEAADQRRGNGSSSGRAVPRNDGDNKSAGSSSATNASAGSDGRSGSDRSRTAVPAYARPRDDRNVTGQAVPRRGSVPDTDHNHGYYPYYPGYIYDPYYSFYYDPFYSARYGYWAPYGYGYGLGYFSYDPFLFGAFGYPYYGGGAYDPSYYGGGGYTVGGSSGGSSSSSQVYAGSGSIRLKIKPRNAEVFIDGLSVGTIDSFDGVFQRLDVQAGPHKVELRAEGYQTEQLDVIVTAGETVTYKGDLKRR